MPTNLPRPSDQRLLLIAAGVLYIHTIILAASIIAAPHPE
jgi:hypothetical protein